MKNEVSFLGHVIGFGYIKPDPAKIEALFHYPRPYTLTQLQSFLGLAQYYRKFMEHFAQIAGPLYKLTTKEKTITSKNNKLNWNEKCKIHYKSGKTHTNADALSRWPLPIDDEKVQAQQLQHVADEKEPKIVINLIDIKQAEPEPQQFEISPVEQDKDQSFNWIKNLILEKGEKRPEFDQFDSNFHKRLYDLYEHLCIDKNLLLLKKENGTKLVVLPKHLMIQTIEKVHKCLTCHKVKQPKQLQRAQLQPIRPNKLLQLITIDITGPLPTSKNGNCYFLVICCHFSKWVALCPMNNTTSDKLAQNLIRFMMQFGLCTNIHSDLGTNFQSELMRKIYDLLDIHQLKTTAYHPECDGLTERFNRTPKTMIACYVNENQNNWDELLPFLSYAYNTSTHSTTNHSPYEVIFGRKPKIPIDLIIAESAENNEEGDVTVDLNATETENNYNEKSQVDQISAIIPLEVYWNYSRNLIIIK
ncbi:unnamed protein product [Brachionus calyciflorus]|uniref:Integrase catalytic domain-containing protein n=1 Tax=Brachionus calyciflorus TaxID=104777 RepID=A0A813LZF8_9BILA|nr:unnamed protein product [Brachionus calyciflorus]